MAQTAQRRVRTRRQRQHPTHPRLDVPGLRRRQRRRRTLTLDGLGAAAVTGSVGTVAWPAGAAPSPEPARPPPASHRLPPAMRRPGVPLPPDDPAVNTPLSPLWRRPDRTRRAGLRASLPRRPETLQHHVRVRPREPERAHSGPHRTLHHRPRRRLRRHLQRQPGPVHLRIRGLEVQMPRDRPVVHRQHHLTNPATPAADSRWPMFVFTEPIRRGRSGDRPRPYAAAAACASTRSPSSVPVPAPPGSPPPTARDPPATAPPR